MAVDHTPPAGRAGLAAAVAGAGALGLYLATLAPTLVDGDNPELVTAVHTLGVPHPTGYPLWLLLSKLLELALPVGSVAYRLNVVGALYAAGAVALVAWTAARLSGRTWAGLAAGLLAAAGAGLWGQAVAFEVYSLHALLVALLVAGVVWWQEAPSGRRAALVAAAAGLGLAHHRTAIFFGLPALVIVGLGTPKRDWRLALRMAGLAAAPSLLYLALIPLAAREPALNWGAVDHGWQYFARHVSGGQYRAFALQRPVGMAAQVAAMHWGRLLAGSTVALPLLAAAGLAATPGRGWRLLTGLGAGLTLCWAYLYNVEDALVFALPAELMLALWAGLGLAALPRLAPRLPAGWRRPLAAGLPAVVAAAMLANLVLTNLPAVSQRGRWGDYTMQRLALAGLPPQAVYLTDRDAAYGSMLYLQQVEHMRPDVTVIPALLLRTSPLVETIRDKRMAAALRAMLLEDAEHRAATGDEYNQRLVAALAPATGGRPLCASFTPRSFAPGYAWLDNGLVQQVLPAWPAMEEPVSPIAAGGGPVSCLGASVSPRRVRPGELFTLELRWVVRSPRYERATINGAFVQETAGRPAVLRRAFPLCYGRTPLPANRPGMAYVQRIPCMAPPNQPPGRYTLVLGSPLRPAGEEWRWAGAVEIGP